MYLTSVQLAESLGVTESAVEAWVRQEGLPAVPDRGRLLFDRAEVAAWAASRGLGSRVGFLAVESRREGRRASLVELLQVGGIWRDVRPESVRAVIAARVGALPGLSPELKPWMVERARTAEGLTWAPIGGGTALPHLRVPVTLRGRLGTVAIILVSGELVLEEPAPDGLGIRWLIFFVAPSPRVHLEMLRDLSRALSRGQLGAALRSGASDAVIYSAMAEAGIPPEGCL